MAEIIRSARARSRPSSGSPDPNIAATLFSTIALRERGSGVLAVVDARFAAALACCRRTTRRSWDIISAVAGLLIMFVIAAILHVLQKLATTFVQRSAMNDQTSPGRLILPLNQLPMSVAIHRLFRKEKVTPEGQLAVVALLYWAAENLDVRRAWVDPLAGAAGAIELRDPVTLQHNLTVPAIEQATSLAEAGELLLQRLADLAPYQG
ncbi:hypothetical protein QTH90_23855 [Variovorax sp. J2P1-59]|uniref:hypothetical protein n=1 Tax=Variovorax flavidus TaxID=3053501 RepID=UPI002576B3DB|nr:hypothetical protein [Variovorax sp. J2P1-59]MDM0077462.1 hypothetical protein [Variovorax sp. J2P1-59]